MDNLDKLLYIDGILSQLERDFSGPVDDMGVSIHYVYLDKIGRARKYLREINKSNKEVKFPEVIGPILKYTGDEDLQRDNDEELLWDGLD
jgi:hypothetical protein